MPVQTTDRISSFRKYRHETKKKKIKKKKKERQIVVTRDATRQTERGTEQHPRALFLEEGGFFEIRLAFFFIYLFTDGAGASLPVLLPLLTLG